MAPRPYRKSTRPGIAPRKGVGGYDVTFHGHQSNPSLVDRYSKHVAVDGQIDTNAIQNGDGSQSLDIIAAFAKTREEKTIYNLIGKTTHAKMSSHSADRLDLFEKAPKRQTATKSLMRECETYCRDNPGLCDVTSDHIPEPVLTCAEKPADSTRKVGKRQIASKSITRDCGQAPSDLCCVTEPGGTRQECTNRGLVVDNLFDVPESTSVADPEAERRDMKKRQTATKSVRIVNDVHKPAPRIRDSFVPDGDPLRADRSLPPGFAIRKSGIPDAGLGVWFDGNGSPLETGTVFGPYIGKVVAMDSPEANTSEYCWEIVNGNLSLSHCIDGRDVANSNWMRYVNCPNTVQQQNLTAFQNRGQIYYRTIESIEKGTELLLWYGDVYAKTLGLKVDSEKTSTRSVSHLSCNVGLPANDQIQYAPEDTGKLPMLCLRRVDHQKAQNEFPNKKRIIRRYRCGKCLLTFTLIHRLWVHRYCCHRISKGLVGRGCKIARRDQVGSVKRPRRRKSHGNGISQRDGPTPRSPDPATGGSEARRDGVPEATRQTICDAVTQVTPSGPTSSNLWSRVSDVCPGNVLSQSDQENDRFGRATNRDDNPVYVLDDDEQLDGPERTPIASAGVDCFAQQHSQSTERVEQHVLETVVKILGDSALREDYLGARTTLSRPSEASTCHGTSNILFEVVERVPGQPYSMAAISIGPNNSNYEDRPFACCFCSWRSKISAHLNEHMMNMHEAYMIRRCLTCHRSFDFPRQLFKHHKELKHSGSEKIYVGPDDELDAGLLPREVRLKPFGCQICGERVAFFNRLLRHFSQAHAISVVYGCQQCEMKAVDSARLVCDHQKLTGHRRLSRLLIGADGEPVDLATEPLVRARDSGEESPLPASLMLQSPVMPRTLTKNVSKKEEATDKPTATKSHLCKICHAAFARRNHLTVHLRKHGIKTVYSCADCLLQFPSRKLLKGHHAVDSHKGMFRILGGADGGIGSKYVEELVDPAAVLLDREVICDEGQNLPAPLKRLPKKRAATIVEPSGSHSIVPKKAVSHRCEVCFATFTRRNSLAMHLKSHGITTEYRCADCLLQFQKYQCLLSHQRKEAFHKGVINVHVVSDSPGSNKHIFKKNTTAVAEIPAVSPNEGLSFVGEVPPSDEPSHEDYQFELVTNGTDDSMVSWPGGSDGTVHFYDVATGLEFIATDYDPEIMCDISPPAAVSVDFNCDGSTTLESDPEAVMYDLDAKFGPPAAYLSVESDSNRSLHELLDEPDGHESIDRQVNLFGSMSAYTP